MAALTHYTFRSEWHVDAYPADVFEVLGDLEDYPSWWREVREVRQLDERSVAVLVRASLPYHLRFVMEEARRDREAGVLEVKMTGDLEGFSRWTVTAAEVGSELTFEEEVFTNKKILNRLTPIAKPAFSFNHRLMMRHGQAGLRTYMAGYRRARRD